MPDESNDFGTPPINEENQTQKPEPALLKVSPERQQTLDERKQRKEIGKWLSFIVLPLPLVMLAALWWFMLCNKNELEEFSTLFIVMFSATHIAVVTLYAVLISGVFQKTDKHDKEKEHIPSDMLERLSSTVSDLSDIIKNITKK